MCKDCHKTVFSWAPLHLFYRSFDSVFHDVTFFSGVLNSDVNLQDLINLFIYHLIVLVSEVARDLLVLVYNKNVQTRNINRTRGVSIYPNEPKWRPKLTNLHFKWWILILLLQILTFIIHVQANGPKWRSKWSIIFN